LAFFHSLPLIYFFICWRVFAQAYFDIAPGDTPVFDPLHPDADKPVERERDNDGTGSEHSSSVGSDIFNRPHSRRSAAGGGESKHDNGDDEEEEDPTPPSFIAVYTNEPLAVGGRPYPYPKWLPALWRKEPMPIIGHDPRLLHRNNNNNNMNELGSPGTPAAGGTNRSSGSTLVERLNNLLSHGVEVSRIRDLTTFIQNDPLALASIFELKTALPITDVVAVLTPSVPSSPGGVYQPPAKQMAPTSSDADAHKHFIKLSFSSVEEARRRALCLVVNTWEPLFPERRLLPLMTLQHFEHCMRLKHLTPKDERRCVFLTFWANSYGPPPLPLASAHLSYDSNFALDVTRIHALSNDGAQGDLPAVDTRPMPHPIVGECDAQLAVSGVATSRAAYQPTLDAMKKEQAHTQRLTSRRLVAERRLKLYEDTLQQKERIHQQLLVHRVKVIIFDSFPRSLI
jgi:hypothetical protein